MGVYINMKIPTTCEKCNLESFCDKWIEARKMCEKLELKLGVKATIRHPECPLISIQAHGRLIDADALWVEINKICDRYDAGIITDLVCLQQILSAIRYAPTVIPAEEDEA